MDIKKFIEKYKKKISKREEDIKDFKESHNPELINAIPAYERENAEYKTIIDCLEKQMPKEVNKSSENKLNTNLCPTCSREVGFGHFYCESCGQKLIWG